MIPVIDIIGRAPETVERLLGKPDKIEVVMVSDRLPALKAYYLKGRLDILYIDNIADWIAIVDRDSTIIDDFVKILGLRPTKENFQFQGRMGCFNIHGLKEVVLYGNDEGKMWKVQIKAFTL
jgi:hypothetical protein